MAAPAILIDSVLAYKQDYIVCGVTHQKENAFTLKDGRVPSWICLEYIAQSACIYDGITRQQKSLAPRHAFLLGTRKLEVSKAYFEKGEKLTIEAERVLKTELGISAFKINIFSELEKQPVVSDALVKAIATQDSEKIIFKSE